MENSWDSWLDQALQKLYSTKLIRTLRPIFMAPPSNGYLGNADKVLGNSMSEEHFETFDGIQPWDREAVEVEITESTFQKWMNEFSISGHEAFDVETHLDNKEGVSPRDVRKLILFSGNDYLGLSSHPMVRKAAAKAAQDHGMGPRGSALICGYTHYHRVLESSLASLKKKEDCLLCPTGFSANMAVMASVGNIASLLSVGRKPSKREKVAIFSDALNHASLIDGIRLVERHQEAVAFVYRHCDMIHLDGLLSSCEMEKKVVVSDSLFSMDGDFAPIAELVELRQKHNFLLVIDDAHGTLICGENGGGVAELCEAENYIDICIGTLSKAAGCHGGFIACSQKWKQLIQSRGRSFIFSTALPVPVAAAAHAAITVARKEKWRRKAIWSRVREFTSLTNMPVSSPIISLIIGNEESALLASRHMLKSGFHITAIRPPTVPSNSCRLRVTLSAAHTSDDVKALCNALFMCVDFSCANSITSSNLLNLNYVAHEETEDRAFLSQNDMLRAKL
ncbi:8-amino-7-oxononanoate synthase isoform X1 [Amborella trichopoda]|uniref:8-amino-7-oxononanoate synthase isoform X1 n=1 Tax=Amborella trichopoda TaxID=13333 RepID=UPI0005D3EC56|nr:8-amino-7-oxononanoate synthase isoform X1 [Amborella trichopoda]|eukprot:XP_011621169.1 8-amino-7-oxononanoate synthase isoform X1 [Amborella trichopoda]